MHIEFNKATKEYNCSCGYLKNEKGSVKAARHAYEYNVTENWAAYMFGNDLSDGEYRAYLRAEDVVRNIPRSHYGDLPVHYNDYVPRGTAYLINSIDLGKHLIVGDYAPVTVEVEPKPKKKKWYLLWLR